MDKLLATGKKRILCRSSVDYAPYGKKEEVHHCFIESHAEDPEFFVCAWDHYPHWNAVVYPLETLALESLKKK